MTCSIFDQFEAWFEYALSLWLWLQVAVYVDHDGFAALLKREGLTTVDNVGYYVMNFPDKLNEYDVLIDSYIARHPYSQYDKNIADFLKAGKGLLGSTLNNFDYHSVRRHSYYGNQLLSKYGIAWVSQTINFGPVQVGDGVPINRTQLDFPKADLAINRVTQGGEVSDQDLYTIGHLFDTAPTSEPLISAFLQFRQTKSYFRYSFNLIIFWVDDQRILMYELYIFRISGI